MPPVNPDAPVEAFLRKARRRYVTRELLGALGASAGASLAIEYAAVLANRRLGLELPPVSIGPALLVLAGVACLRRNRIPPVAARADAALRLKDRLVTFLDFRGRTDVDDDLRRLQGREAAAALAGVDLARGIRVPRLLLAGPLLFCWMLYVDYFAYSVPFDPPALRQVVRVAGPHRAGPGSAEAPDTGGAAAPQEPPGAPAPGTESGVEPPPAAAPPQPGAPDQGAADATSAGAGGEGASLPGAVPGMIGEPARLYSEPVGAALTPVAPDASGGRSAAVGGAFEPPPRGRISFNLVPADGEGGGAGGEGTPPGGGTGAGFGITIDYDAVPPEHRVHVRRYFNALVRLFQGGSDGT